jgi:beta-phosphoglucomutase
MPAVIFDVDGVLVDSYQAHYRSWRELAQLIGREMTQGEFAATFGRTSRDIIAELWADASYTEAEIAELDARKEALYRDIVSARFPAMTGARELIVALAGDGFALAVGSSGPPENVQVALEHVDPRGLIRHRVTGLDVTRGKPDPQVFSLAAQRIDVRPECCAVIEDAPAGIQAARGAGMTAIGLVSTGRTRRELAAADLVVESLTELTPTIIRQLLLCHR